MFSTQELRIGATKDHPPRVFFQEGRGRWLERVGYILKFGKQSWAWNSFKVKPYLSDTEHAETFPSVESAERWRAKHKLQGVVTELVRNDGDPWPMVWPGR